MIPRQPPTANEPADDPTEFERPLDFSKPYGGPRRFAEMTAGSQIADAGASNVIDPENTRSSAL